MELCYSGQSRLNPAERVPLTLWDLESSRAVARKGLQPVVFMLLVELCERFTFFAIVCNMIIFCTLKLSYPYDHAAIANLSFIGASTMMPVLMGWTAELLGNGRMKVIYLCTFLHLAGTVLLPVVAFPFEDFYIDQHHIAHTMSRGHQTLLFYAGLVMAAIGSGGIRAIICPLSAYGLQGYRAKQLLPFFNWYHWLVNINALVVFLGISYIQGSVARNLGFLIPFVSLVMALLTIHMARNDLIYQPMRGGSLLTTAGVFLNALRMCCVHLRHVGGHVTTWLDRAKEYYGGRYSEAHVEDAKALTRLLPLFTLQILYRVCVMQVSAGFFIQSMNSRLVLVGVALPIAAMKIISIVPLLILAPCVEGIRSYLTSRAGSGPRPSLAIVWGQVGAALSLLVAGLYEIERKRLPLVEQRMSGEELLVSSMSCLHLAPQYILLGLAEALAAPACSAITFSLSPGRIRGVAMAIMSLFQGLSCFVGVALITVATITSEGDWFPSLLSEGHLERFFFLLSAMMLLNCLLTWRIAHRYECLDGAVDPGFPGFQSEALEEKLLLHDRSLRFYETFQGWPDTYAPVEMTL
ncbi:solute carrier family 15 member 5 [Gastrophryne carolinensis]